MKHGNYTREFTVANSPQAVFDAIGDVRAWWTINADGPTRSPGDEFTVQFGDVHFTKQRIAEAVPGRRMVWKVTESILPWLKDREEWKGTEIIFEMAVEQAGTRLRFTHAGLTRNVECYQQCEKGWDYFLDSLWELITTGTGRPDTTERTHMDSIGHVSPKNT